MCILAWSHTEPHPSSSTGACALALSAGESGGVCPEVGARPHLQPLEKHPALGSPLHATECPLCPGAESAALIQCGD